MIVIFAIPINSESLDISKLLSIILGFSGMVLVTGKSVGYYTVYYRDGRNIDIPLVENRNIIADNVGWTHRLNSVNHIYDTDGRMHGACYFTKKLKKG